MRFDNRRPDELRPVSMTTGFVKHPEGSVLIQCGNTRVLCNATVQEEVPRWMKGKGSGWVTAEYSLLPRSTNSRVDRERKGPSGRTQEIQRLIGRSLRAAVDLKALGERSIIVDCDVIEADGGTRTASITGAFVALGIALQKIKAEAGLDAQLMQGWLAAVSVGVSDGLPVLDLCYEEDSKAGTDMNVVAFDSERIVEVQGTAEHGAFSRKEFDALLDLALSGIAQLQKLQQEALGELP